MIALLRRPASADELLFARPATAWLEAAVIIAIVVLPVFGFAARSVLKRSSRRPGPLIFRDWAAGVGAALFALFVVLSAVILLGVLVWD